MPFKRKSLVIGAPCIYPINPPYLCMEASSYLNVGFEKSDTRTPELEKETAEDKIYKINLLSFLDSPKRLSEIIDHPDLLDKDFIISCVNGSFVLRNPKISKYENFMVSADRFFAHEKYANGRIYWLGLTPVLVYIENDGINVESLSLSDAIAVSAFLQDAPESAPPKIPKAGECKFAFGDVDASDRGNKANAQQLAEKLRQEAAALAELEGVAEKYKSRSQATIFGVFSRAYQKAANILEMDGLGEELDLASKVFAVKIGTWER